MTWINLFLSPHKKTEQQKSPACSPAVSPCSAVHFNYSFRPFSIVSVLCFPLHPRNTHLYFTYLMSTISATWSADLLVLYITSITRALYFIIHDLYVVPYAFLHSFPISSHHLMPNSSSFWNAVRRTTCWYCSRWCFGEKGSGAQLRWADLKLQFKFSRYGGCLHQVLL